ncbi:hypothetical protein OF83DRAFT_1150084 [Amylostereum chailletii]|nr:hypothetical protein OF83DRAFT_1150084 [Amylostereum chailletii]
MRHANLEAGTPWRALVELSGQPLTLWVLGVTCTVERLFIERMAIEEEEARDLAEVLTCARVRALRLEVEVDGDTVDSLLDAIPAAAQLERLDLRLYPKTWNEAKPEEIANIVYDLLAVAPVPTFQLTMRCNLPAYCLGLCTKILLDGAYGEHLALVDSENVARRLARTIPAIERVFVDIGCEPNAHMRTFDVVGPWGEGDEGGVARDVCERDVDAKDGLGKTWQDVMGDLSGYRIGYEWVHLF